MWGRSRRKAQLLPAMTNPCGLLCMTTPLCSSLPNIFMCSSAPESPQRILLPASYLAYTGRLTVKCNWLLLERQTLSKLLHQFTKEVVEKTNQAFGCQEIQAFFYSLEWQGWLSPEEMTNVATKLVLLFALSWPSYPSSNGCGKELFKKVTLVKTLPLSTFRAKAAVASCLPLAASCPLLHFQGAPAITGSLLPSILKKREEMRSLNKIA